MEEILKYCLKVNGLKTYFPNHGKESIHSLEADKSMYNKYNYENKKVAFVLEDGSYYVSPFYVELTEYLNSHGFIFNSELYVPFSRANVPSDIVSYNIWKDLCNKANERYEEQLNQQRLKEYERIANNKNLKSVPYVLTNSSLELPKSGLEFVSNNKLKSVHPMYEWQIPSYIGFYGNNLDTILYIDEFGKTYITPANESSLEILNDCNYDESTLYVPIHTYDTILNTDYDRNWKKICTSQVNKNEKIKTLKKTL